MFTEQRGKNEILSTDAQTALAEKLNLDPEEVYGRLLNVYDQLKHQEIYFELAARMLNPKITVKNKIYTWDLDSLLFDEKHGYNYDISEATFVLKIMSFIYGHYAEMNDADIKVSQFLGENASTPELLKQKLNEKILETDSKEVSAKGHTFLLHRARKLDNLTNVIYQVLDDYI